jgi:hypothetical protein
MQLTQSIGESRTYRIPLRWDGRNFAPNDDWVHFFIVKTNEDDPDDEALIEKASGGYGLVISGDDAVVTIIPRDTRGDAEAEPPVEPLTTGTKYWSVLSLHSVTGERRYPNSGTLELRQGRKQLDETAIPIYTTEDPAPLLKGETGDQGEAATIEVGTVTTVSPATPASVSNSGTSGAAVFDFEIPQGLKGDKGDTGDTGPAATLAQTAITAAITNKATFASDNSLLSETRHRGFTIHTVAGGGNYFVTNYEGRIALETTSFSTAMHYALDIANTGHRKRIHLSGGAVGSLDDATRPKFIVDAPIIISSSVIITGDEDNATIIEPAPDFHTNYPARSLFECGEIAFLGSYVVFKGLRIQSGAAAYGIAFYQVTQPKVWQCYLNSGVSGGILFGGSGFIFSAQVSDCDIQTARNAASGILVNHCSDLIVSRSTFRVGASGSPVCYGITVQGTASAVTISNNVFIRSVGPHPAIRVIAGRGINITDNCFRAYTTNFGSAIQFVPSVATTFNAFISGNLAAGSINNTTSHDLIFANADASSIALGDNFAPGFRAVADLTNAAFVVTGLFGVTPATIGAVASNPSGVTGAAVIGNAISLTQGQYDAIVTKNPSTLYVVMP